MFAICESSDAFYLAMHISGGWKKCPLNNAQGKGQIKMSTAISLLESGLSVVGD